jgi:CMP-N-acetylneuraminic acid synthetase
LSERISAFIPLKGHSARVPGKNLRPFGDRPLFHVIVNTLQTADMVGTIYIDTDDDGIADSAAQLDDVVVVRRKAHLVGDDISVNWLIKDWLTDHPSIDLALQTHSTNPLLRSETMDAALSAWMDNEKVTSLFTVTRHQARFYDRDLNPINHDPSELIKTQDLPPMLEENSNLYAFTREGFFENETRITPDPMPWEMDPLEAIDIDEEHDFRLAVMVARLN